MNNTLQPNTTNWVVIYRKQKQDRINYLNSHYSGLYKNNRKKPWYMMTTGKCFNYEERKESWGNIVDYFQVPSETATFNKKNTVIKKMWCADFMERMSQHKLRKWCIKNPEPNYNQDLFPEEYRKAYEDAKNKALERIRDMVVLIYDKTVLPVEKNNCKLIPIIQTKTNIYTYPNMDPFVIGYPLCKYNGQKFIEKEKIIELAKNTIKKVKKSGYNCIGIQYQYNGKKLFELAA